MQLEIRPPENSNIFDLVLNTYVSLNLIPKFIFENNILDINENTKVGDIFIFDSDFIFDETIFNKIVQNDLKFITSYKRNGLKASFENYLLTENSDILSSESNSFFLL